MEVTGVAQWQAWHQRRLPPVEEVRPGLWSIPLPNAESGVRYVLSYAFVHDSGVTLVDPGWRDRDSWDALVDGLGKFGCSVCDVRSIIVTHHHPDHLGLADLVAAESGADVLMHPADMPALPSVVGDVREGVETVDPFLRRHGLPADELAHLHRDPEGLHDFAALRRPTGVLEDRQFLDVPDWHIQAVRTPGHTPGHVCLYLPRERILLSGDHLLPRITPNISAFPANGDDPLGAYLGSLRQTAALPVDEVLPAHEYRFGAMPARVEAILRHHEEREAELCEVLDRAHAPLTGSEVSRLLKWSRPFDEIAVQMRRTALAETVAHLVTLELSGQVRREVSGTAEPARWVLAS